MTREEIQAAAAALDAADRTRAQMGLLSLAHPGMSMDDAYVVQAAWVDIETRARRAARHRPPRSD